MALAGIALTLSGCGKLKDSSLANNATTTSTTKKKAIKLLTRERMAIPF